MPTVQVTPSSFDLLQDVANTLGKARKVVIITGAGISTNSGIPDFRSENGLYSLIQQQFERAEANGGGESDDEAADFEINERPAKRRRVSRPDEENSPEQTDVVKSHVSDVSAAQDGLLGKEENVASKQGIMTPPAESSRRLTRSQMSTLRPSLPRHMTEHSEHSSTSQDSVFSNPQLSGASSQTEDSTISSAPGSRGPQTRANTPKKVLLGGHFSSSPLSSPPPVLFDPYEHANTSTDSSSQAGSDCSESSVSDDTQNTLDFFSQTSNTGLRNMKGRDLFDCNIWADPLKTSVFYRFATSLRQRVREVEPTTTHRFIAQLRDVGKLTRVYTQNIDEIEKKIGLSTDLKNGAGNKRRKSAKQQLADVEKDTKDTPDAPKSKGEEDSGNTEPALQGTEEAPRSKPRPTLTQDKGVECVFLHGSLHSLRCFVCGKLCDWDEDGREGCTMSGEQPECPHCAGATAARQEKGKRALGVGKLRPDIVLYGEEHPQSDLISPIVQHDLSAGPDLLLVLGTSLRVHGLKVMVKEFAKSVHNKGGKVVFINFTKPSESAWGDVIDYWIEWDCDAWVDDLKDRKPHLWMSPEEIQDLEQQRRDALAEKKKESLNRKRESIGEKRRQTIEVSKLRPPPKNPSAMRNDYQCGAYIVWEIFQSLAKIGNRPFDNLGHTPRPILAPPPAPEPSTELRPKPKAKKPRKSAPAALSTVGNPESKPKPAVKAKLLASRTENAGKDQYAKAAKGLARTGRTPTPARLATLNRTPTPKAQTAIPPPQQPSSITTAVKTKPRQRKRKVIDGVEVGAPIRSTSSIPPPTLPLPTPTNVVNRRNSGKELALPSASGMLARGPVLPPLHRNWKHSTPARIEPMEPIPVVSPQSPLANLHPAIRPAYAMAVHQATYPMYYSDPLVRLPYEVDYKKAPRENRSREDHTPSPSDQLRREEWETAYQLERMRGGG